MQDELLYKDESYAIIGACFEVYNQVGCGFPELVYQECLEIEFELRGVPNLPQEELMVSYKGHVLKKTFEPDFLCYDKIIVEIKAENDLINAYRSQVFNYLKATGFRLGLLVNFGQPGKLQYERIIR